MQPRRIRRADRSLAPTGSRRRRRPSALSEDEKRRRARSGRLGCKGQKRGGFKCRIDALDEAHRREWWHPFLGARPPLGWMDESEPMGPRGPAPPLHSARRVAPPVSGRDPPRKTLGYGWDTSRMADESWFARAHGTTYTVTPAHTCEYTRPLSLCRLDVSKQHSQHSVTQSRGRVGRAR